MNHRTFDRARAVSCARLTAAALVVFAGAAPGALAADTESNTISGAAMAEVREVYVPLAFDSGVVAHPDAAADAGDVRLIYQERVHVPDAWSVRLVFNQAQLAGEVGSGDESFIVITSELDGHQQVLDAEALTKWQHTSAYFNGDAVTVEMYASPGTGDNRLRIAAARTADLGRATRSICGSTDDRVPSTDPRSGRVWPIGCTAWLFNNQQNCMLTAGHCGPSTTQVIEFNVPLSSSSGTPQHPGPQDQYPVDPASIQSNGGQGTGNDWAYFGVFDNTDTGLSPLQAQGASYQLASSAPSVAGQQINIIGYGVTGAGVPASYDLAQKTHVGPFSSSSGNLIRYATDTTGGNSGSAVFDMSTGLAIGIHTHAGCTSSGGSNQGTAIQHPSLQAALADPQGICASFLSLGYATPLPESINPDGGDTLQARVTANGVTLEPGTVEFNVDTGSGFVAYPMTQIAGDLYEGVFPPSTCGDTVAFYVSAQDAEGLTYTNPPAGAAQPSTVLSTDTLGQLALLDFETAPAGWGVVNEAIITGGWERAVPGNFGFADPATDFDGSGACYVTDNRINADVDGGPTRLTTELFDLSGALNPTLSYARYFSKDDDPSFDPDSLTVEFSDNAGATWITVESIDAPAGWTQVTHTIADYVGLTAQFQVRFTVVDNPNNSVTEAAIDAFEITDPRCDTACSIADLNGDGATSPADIDLFVDLFIDAVPGNADLDGDGDEDADDITAFVNAFVAGC